LIGGIAEGRSMARTQAADYDERREAIVTAAAALYARSGFAATSVADIAKRCRMSKSAIYHYFGAKEDILYEAMIGHVRALEAVALEVAAGAAPAAQKFRDLIQRFMGLYAGAADRHKVLLNELDHLPRARRAEIVTIQRGLIGIVSDLVVAIEPSLGRKRARAFAVTMLIFGSINWTHTWFNPKGAIDVSTLAEAAVDMALGGLGEVARRAR
jgi:AcrR family transcriptional regulator